MYLAGYQNYLFLNVTEHVIGIVYALICAEIVIVLCSNFGKLLSK